VVKNLSVEPLRKKKARSHCRHVASISNGGGGEGGGDENNDEGGEGDENAKNMLSEDHNDWYCSVCMAFEREGAEEEDELLSCDGPCLRSFHLSCVGIDAVPDSDTWLCDACKEKEHTCFLCHDSGRDVVTAIDGACEENQGGAGDNDNDMGQEDNMGQDRVVKCQQSRCCESVCFSHFYFFLRVINIIYLPV
jgi:hypothetical protein